MKSLNIQNMTNIRLLFKIALDISGISMKHFSDNLEKPDGEVGINASAVSRAAIGGDWHVRWVRREIIAFIDNARETHKEEFIQLAEALHPEGNVRPDPDPEGVL